MMVYRECPLAFLQGRNLLRAQNRYFAPENPPLETDPHQYRHLIPIGL
jgi:hypothetical protein